MINLYFLLINVIITFVTGDNLALLSGTLRTFMKLGCYNDVVSLKCPPGTSISVELAQYKKSVSNIKQCSSHDNQEGRDKYGSGNHSCQWPTAMQSKWDELTRGTWGRTVVEACQKKSSCKFQASSRTAEDDPCLQEDWKYIEVTYKCRPYEFRSKIACENERIILQCNPNSRVAIYSASYGRTEYENFQCPQPQGVTEETCLVSYATETVIQICHGKRSCQFSADNKTFGNPCRPVTRMYLRIVYTCVPRRILQYEESPSDDETDLDTTLQQDQDDVDNYDAAAESAASPTMPNMKSIEGAENNNKDNKLLDYINSQGKQRTIYFYLILTVVVVILLCVALLTTHFLQQCHSTKQNEKIQSVEATDITVTNDFAVNISEVNVDIDMSLHSHAEPTNVQHRRIPSTMICALGENISRDRRDDVRTTAAGTYYNG